MSTASPCTKAIIAVAGYGTRRLPITKAIEKCLLPVGNRPIVDYIVDDCIAAGITEIIFVVGEQSDQIRQYYGHNAQLEQYLQVHGKVETLQHLNNLVTKAKFSYVVQNNLQPYGTSTPVWLARKLIKPGEQFLYLYGDNIFYKADGSSAVAEFLERARKADTAAAMMAVEVPLELVSNYGIVDTHKRGKVELYDRIIEKPTPEEAPSNLNNAGCFLFNSDILPCIVRSMQRSPQEERYVIDALNWYAQAGNAVAVVRTSSEWLDCGTVGGWLHANNRIASQHTVEQPAKVLV